MHGESVVPEGKCPLGDRLYEVLGWGIFDKHN